MTRVKTLYGAVALTAVVAAITVGSKQSLLKGAFAHVSSPANLQDALNAPPVIAQYHLYSGARDVASGMPLVNDDRKIDVLGKNGVEPVLSYATNKDQSGGDSRYSDDGGMIESSSYYPSVDGSRHLHVKSQFVDRKLADEDVRHYDGTPQMHTKILASGEKHVVNYDEDGITVLDDAVYVPDDCCGRLIVKSERRFRSGKEHLLAYSNVLNDDGSRNAEELDEHLNALRTEQWPKDKKIPGTVITVLYPDTLNKRLISRTDSSFDVVDYFRKDGTLERRVKISPASVRVILFDLTGKRPLFEQSWCQELTSENGVSVSKWFLSDLYELNEQGHKSRDVSYTTDGFLLYDMKYGVTVDGVNYARAVFDYDPNGVLKVAKYYIEGSDDMYFFSRKPDREDVYQLSANVRFVEPLSAAVQPLDLDSSLPVPPAQWFEH